MFKKTAFSKEHLNYKWLCTEGRSIAFDAKEISNASFPLENLLDHQYEILESWHKNKAFSFLVVSFRKYNKTYLLPFEVLQKSF
ncbi:Holliday junction resolvase RecU [Lysinibacillus sp. NPDC058147]|uniref:Holliday junction resolvase RecU n=1 Tax=unclassified Lysinibacillus TaxID=2636778 RepID=UPI0036DCDDA4